MKHRLIPLLLALSITAVAQVDPNVIRLNMTGEVMVSPNEASYSVAVTTQAQTAQAAASENAQKMDTLVKTLKQAVGEKGQVQTSQYQLNPVYFYNKDTQQSSITAYRASNQVMVKTHDLDHLGDLIDTTVKAGGNQIQSLQFSHSDSEMYEKEALDKAIKQGKALAEDIARSANVVVSGIHEISVYDSRPGPMLREAAMSMDAKTPIEAGELSITKQVSMVFNIEG